METTVKIQASVPSTIHRAAMVQVAKDASSLGHYVATLIAKDLGLTAPEQPQRGRPKQ